MHSRPQRVKDPATPSSGRWHGGPPFPFRTGPPRLGRPRHAVQGGPGRRPSRGTRSASTPSRPAPLRGLDPAPDRPGSVAAAEDLLGPEPRVEARRSGADPDRERVDPDPYPTLGGRKGPASPSPNTGSLPTVQGFSDVVVRPSPYPMGVVQAPLRLRVNSPPAREVSWALRPSTSPFSTEN